MSGDVTVTLKLRSVPLVREDTLKAVIYDHLLGHLRLRIDRMLMTSDGALVTFTIHDGHYLDTIERSFPIIDDRCKVYYMSMWDHDHDHQSLVVLRNPPQGVSRETVEVYLEGQEINAKVVNISDEDNTITLQLTNPIDLPYLVTKPHKMKRVPVTFEEVSVCDNVVVAADEEYEEDIGKYQEVGGNQNNEEHYYEASEYFQPSSRALKISQMQIGGKIAEDKIKTTLKENYHLEVDHFSIVEDSAYITFTSNTGVDIVLNNPIRRLLGYRVQCSSINKEDIPLPLPKIPPRTRKVPPSSSQVPLSQPSQVPPPRSSHVPPRSSQVHPSSPRVLLLENLPELGEDIIKPNLELLFNNAGCMVDDCTLQGDNNTAIIKFRDQSSLSHVLDHPPDNSTFLGQQLIYTTLDEREVFPQHSEPATFTLIAEDLPDCHNVDEIFSIYLMNTTQVQPVTCEVRDQKAIIKCSSREDMQRIMENQPKFPFFGKRIKFKTEPVQSTPSPPQTEPKSFPTTSTNYNGHDRILSQPVHRVGPNHLNVADFIPELEEATPHLYRSPSPPPLPERISKRKVAYSWTSIREEIPYSSLRYYLYIQREINEETLAVNGEYRVNQQTIEVKPLAGSEEISDWDVQIRGIIRKYKAKFASAELKVESHSTTAIVNYLGTVEREHSDFHYQLGNGIANVAGREDTVSNACKTITNMLAEEIEMTLTLEKPQQYIEYLLKFAINEIEAIRPPVKVTRNPDKPNCIEVRGVQKSLDAFKSITERKINESHQEVIRLNSSAYRLLNSIRGKRKIREELAFELDSIVYVFDKGDGQSEYSNQVYILSPNQNACFTARWNISSLVSEKKLTLSPERSAILSTQDWRQLVEDYTSKYFLHIASRGEDILLTGEEKYLSIAAEQILTYIDVQHRITVELPILAAEWQIISMNRQQKLKAIQNEAKKYKVKLELPDKTEDSGSLLISINGDIKHVDNIKGQLQMLTNEVITKEFQIPPQVGLSQITDKVANKCRELEREHRVIITHEVVKKATNASVGTAGRADNIPQRVISATSSSGLRVRVFTGDPSKMKCDALAIFISQNPSTDYHPIMASLTTTGGSDVQKYYEVSLKSKSSLIAATICRSRDVSNLKCSEIFYCILPLNNVRMVNATLGELFSTAISSHDDIVITPFTGRPHNYPVDVYAESVLSALLSQGMYDTTINIFIEKEHHKEIFLKKMRQLNYTIHGNPTQQTGVGGTGNGLILHVLSGSITETVADVVVNSTSIDMKPGSNAICTAIHNAAGKSLGKACQALKDKSEMLQNGKVHMVDSGDLLGKIKCKKVILVHVPGKLKNVPPTQDQVDYVKDVIKAALKKADNEQLKSLSMPAFCLGVGNYTVPESAKPTLDAIREFSMKSVHLKEVYIIIYNKKLYKQYAKFYEKYAVDLGYTVDRSTLGREGVYAVMRNPRSRADTVTSINLLSVQPDQPDHSDFHYQIDNGIVNLVGLEDTVNDVCKTITNMLAETTHKILDESETQLLQSKVQAHIQEEGKLNISVAKGILYGPPRVGKTSLMKRLIGEEPEPPGECASTGIDAPITVPIYKDAQFMQVAIRQGKDPHKDEWKPQDIKDTLKLCLNSFLPAHKLKEDESLRRSEDPVASTLPSTLAGGNEIIDKDEIVNENEAFSKEYHHVRVIPDSVTNQTNDDIKKPDDNVDIPTKILDFIKNEDWMSAREELKGIEDITLFQIIDVGGQPEFHDILPLLLTGPAMYMLFFNLTQELDQPYTYLYQHEDGSNSLAYKSQLTVFKVLHQILSSISSMSEFSPAIVIGTHLDQIKSTDDVWKPTDDPLKDRMKEHFYYKNNIIPNQVDGENCIVFPVDNINGTMEDEIKPLRHKIKAKLKELKGTPLPTSWALFYYLLKTFDKNGKWYCTLEEAKCLAEDLKIKDVEVALKYFHEQFGSVLYYHDVVDKDNNKYVFCDPNVILSAVNELVAVCFGSNPEKLKIAETLRDTGIVTYEEFSELCSSFSDKLLLTYVIELLKSRHILSSYSAKGTNKYFIPCLLCSSNDVKYVPPQSEEVAPLLLKLSHKDVSCNEFFNFIPPGLFSSTLVKLSNKPGWELIAKKSFIHKNKVTFSCTKSASLSVTLIAQDEWIEVRVNEEPTSLTPSCIDIRKDIEAAINNTNSDSLLGRFLQSIVLNVGFYCQENEHYASMKNETQMACSSCHKKRKYFQPLMGKHKIWFEESNVNTDSQSMSDILLNKIDTTDGFASNIKLSQLTLDLSHSHDIEKLKNLHHEKNTTNIVSSSPSPSLDYVIMSKTPKLNHLVEVLVDISDVWELMGIALGVEHYEISSIKKNETSSDDKMKLTHVLQKWIDKNEDVTWSTIAEVVQGSTVDKKAQVQKINEFLLKPDIYKKYCTCR